MANTDKKTESDVSSAPESGTVRDETSGNKPSDRANRKDTAKADRGGPGTSQKADDPSLAQEER